MNTYRRDAAAIALLTLGLGIVMAALIWHPGYTDAYYYFNAGQRLVQGKGLTDAAIWTYIGAPAKLPIPSHLYWMPLASLVAALGMSIGGPTFDGAQLALVPCYVGLVLVGFWLGAVIGKSRRVAWLSGLITLFSGYFVPYWLTTDTFAIYGLVGALALVTMGLGRRSGNWRWFAASGVLIGLAHLTRADGILLLGVLAIVALWPGLPWRKGLLALGLAVIAYLLVMLPWFIRNVNSIGTILPVGGFQTAWMRSYDELFNYPPVTDFWRFVAWGPGNILASRWDAFVAALQTFVAVEGLVVLTPLMLIALWRRRRDPLLSGFWLYALGLHAAMTLVFAFPSIRGALFHSASALIPFWAALGIAGLDDVLAWIAARRRWRLIDAQRIFGAAALLWAVFLSVMTFNGKATQWNGLDSYYADLAEHFPSDAVVMINDPAALYYYTGLSGVVIPNAAPDVIPDLASRYGVNYVALEANGVPAPMMPLYMRDPSLPLGRMGLKQIYFDGNLRIYKVLKAGESDETPVQ